MDSRDHTLPITLDLSFEQYELTMLALAHELLRAQGEGDDISAGYLQLTLDQLSAAWTEVGGFGG